MTTLANFKNKLVQLAKEEALPKSKGNIKKAGPGIEKFLTPFRKELGKSDPRFLDITFGTD